MTTLLRETEFKLLVNKACQIPEKSYKPKHATRVYDKVANSIRCELIRIVCFSLGLTEIAPTRREKFKRSRR